MYKNLWKRLAIFFILMLENKCFICINVHIFYIFVCVGVWKVVSFCNYLPKVPVILQGRVLLMPFIVPYMWQNLEPVNNSNWAQGAVGKNKLYLLSFHLSVVDLFPI